MQADKKEIETGCLPYFVSIFSFDCVVNQGDKLTMRYCHSHYDLWHDKVD